MFTRRPLRAVSLALLLSLAYGLGAAPCGCWEHSGWRAAVALLSVAPEHAPVDAVPLVEGDCHDCATASALPAERTRLGAFTTWQTSISPVVDGESEAHGILTFSTDCHGAQLSALPLRADLQIFRL